MGANSAKISAKGHDLDERGANQPLNFRDFFIA
jgi:hypothetical protein